MWLTKVDYNIQMIRNSDILTIANDFQEIRQKLNEFRDTDGNGSTLPGYELPTNLLEIPEETQTLKIIRSWNSQEIAEQFVDFMQQYPWIDAAVQEDN